MPTRVGIVADSHVGEFLAELPAGVMRALAGCDVILHAGDICDIAVLDQLGRIGPVHAVAGDHDTGRAANLPRDLVVEVAGRRIGLTHGRRARMIDTAVTLAHVVAGRRLRWRAGLHKALRRRFAEIDCLVYGHWHEPALGRVGSVVCFSPGAVCPWGSLEGGRPPRPGRAGISDRVVRRYRRQLGPEAMRPRVGILEIGPDGITPRSIPLDSY